MPKVIIDEITDKVTVLYCNCDDKPFTYGDKEPEGYIKMCGYTDLCPECNMFPWAYVKDKEQDIFF